MSRITEDQISELRIIDRRGTGIGGEVDGLIRRLTADAVDLDAPPPIPDGLAWTVRPEDQVPGRAAGIFDPASSPQKVVLHLAEAQKTVGIPGNELRGKLAGQRVLGAAALEWYLRNTDRIPEDWKAGRTFFWGTVYRNGGGSLCVRYLCWSGSRWGWYCSWLGDDWLSVDPAAVVASST